MNTRKYRTVYKCSGCGLACAVIRIADEAEQETPKWCPFEGCTYESNWEQSSRCEIECGTDGEQQTPKE